MLRLVSGGVLAVAALAAILFLPVLALRVLACVVAALGAREYLRITRSSFAAVGAVVLSCWIASAGSAAYLSVLVWVVLVLVIVQVLAAGEPLAQAAAGAFAVFYIGVPLGLLVAVHVRLGWPGPVLLMGTVILSDSAQYYTGRLLGRRLLAPAISPKKTVEGALGGIVFGSLFVLLAGPWVFPGASPLSMVALGVSMVLVGICGDLFESRLKRTAHVKDSSALIPGHGGILDRIDALLFATPVFFLYVVGS